MANANISFVQLVNTFNEWRAGTNDLIEDRNILRNANYVKDNGSFDVSNGTITISRPSSNGTLLTIANTGNVFVGGSVNATTMNANTFITKITGINLEAALVSSYIQANTARGTANDAYNQANNAYTQANLAYGQANVAITIGQGAYNQANVARNTANDAYNQANNAYAKANDSISSTFGGTITGDIVITGNLTVSGNSTTLNTEVLTVEDADVVLLSNVAGTPALNAGVIVNRGTSTNTFLRWAENVDKWGWSDNGTIFYSFDTALNAYDQANNAYNRANTIINGSTQIILKSYRDYIFENLDVSGSVTANLDVSNWFKYTLTGSAGNRQITFTNAPAAGTGFTVTLIILQDGSGGKTPTFANTIYWAGGQVPPATTAASARDLWTFTTYDGGSTFLGTLAVKDAK